MILCRNVMIYFDEAEQKRLIEKFWHCLNPAGFLFVGHAESLFGLPQKFRMVHENNGTAYQRVDVASCVVLPKTAAANCALSSSTSRANFFNRSMKQGLNLRCVLRTRKSSAAFAAPSIL